ncbi:MAG: succinylglutamate desuccinylase/aspartoacylase family protein [Haloarculaceae archaeon]
MRVETVGDGPAEIAVVGGIHGDEPCGIHAVETLLAERPALDRAVTFVVANEEAAEREVRYVDEDLNRAFPGDPDADTHEGRLAARLAAVVSGCQILSLHSTQSYGGMFALTDYVDEYERAICPHLSVDAVVETAAFSEGRLFSATDDLLEVECGFQGSERAADNALQVTRQFLAATGALADGPTVEQPALPVYRLVEPVPKTAADAYEVYATNFAEVAPGETYAAAGEREFVAEEPFYPVLMSPYGYEEVFGYTADRVGTLEA